MSPHHLQVNHQGEHETKPPQLLQELNISALEMQVFSAAGAPIEWEEHYVGKEVDPRTGSFITKESMESVLRNKIGLKGPMATPIGKGHKSLNLTLRKELGLYANVRPCLSLPGYKTRYDNVDLVTIRENTEGEYSGLEHQVGITRLVLDESACSIALLVLESALSVLALIICQFERVPSQMKDSQKDEAAL